MHPVTTASRVTTAKPSVYPLFWWVTFRVGVTVHDKIRRDEIALGPPIAAGHHLVMPALEIRNCLLRLMRGRASLACLPAIFAERHDIAQRAAGDLPEIRGEVLLVNFII